jgi:hypothetical protein
MSSSSIGRRSVRFQAALPFLGVIAVVAFILNWSWEMIQMPAFVGMTDRPWKSTVALCTKATFGDVGVTLAVYLVVGLATETLQWPNRRGWTGYAATALLGFYHATLTERSALASGLWSYSTEMIRVPILNVGLWPFVQLGLLIPVSIWSATLICRRLNSTTTRLCFLGRFR